MELSQLQEEVWILICLLQRGAKRSTREKTYLVAHLGTGDKRMLDQTAHCFMQTKMPNWKAYKKKKKGSEITKEKLSFLPAGISKSYCL